MAKLGGKYETIFVVDSTLTDEATAAIVEKFKTLVEQNATLGEVNEWASAVWLIPSTTRTRVTTS